MALVESAGAPYVQSSATNVQATASFTPTANALLVAIVGCGNGAGKVPATPFLAITDTLGGTVSGWTQLALSHVSGGGVAGVFVADAGASPTAGTVTVTATPSTVVNLGIIVRQFAGAAPAASQTGATAIPTGTINTVSVTPSATGSQIVAGFGQPSTGAKTANAATTIYGQTQGSAGDTLACIEGSSLTTSGSAQVLGFSTAAKATSAFAAAEILAASGSTVSITAASTQSVALAATTAEAVAVTGESDSSVALAATTIEHVSITASIAASSAVAATVTENQIISISAALTAFAGLGYDAAVSALAPAEYWKLSDPVSSPTVVDSSGNGFTGTVVGGVTLGTTGIPNDGGGTAAAFDGSSGYITTLAPNPPSNSQFSINLWAYIPTVQGVDNFPYMLACMSASRTLGIGLGAGYLVGSPPYSISDLFFVVGNGSTQVEVDWFGIQLSSNQWHQITAVFDGANLNLYCDTAFVATAACAGWTAGTQPWSIGADNGFGSGYDDFWLGDIGQVAIFDYALTTGEIEALNASTLNLTVSVALTSSISASATVAASPAEHVALTSSISASAAVAASLNAPTPITAAITATSVVAANSTELVSLTSSVTATSSIGASAVESIALSVGVTSSAALSASGGEAVSISAAVSAALVLAGTVTSGSAGALTTAIAASAAVAATASATLSISAAISTTSAVTAASSQTISISSSVSALSSFAATTSRAVRLTSSIQASASLVAQCGIGLGLNTTVSASAVIAGDVEPHLPVAPGIAIVTLAVATAEIAVASSSAAIGSESATEDLTRTSATLAIDFSPATAEITLEVLQ